MRYRVMLRNKSQKEQIETLNGTHEN